jgi:4-hydroxybenzoyl-CoA reductase subunit beta
MLPLPTFDLEIPDTAREAARLAAAGGHLLSGGTDLLPSMKHRLFTPEVVVSTRGIQALREVDREGLETVLGAGLSLAEVARLTRHSHPALADACRTVATPTIQRMGTLGGNVMLDTRCLFYNQPRGWREAVGGCLKKDGSVCHVAPKGKGCYAAHSADTVPVLLLFGARLRFAGPQEDFELPLAALYRDDGMDWLAVPRGSVLTAVVLPPARHPVAHRKLRTRAAIDYALLLVAVERGASRWRAVVSAVGPRPTLVDGPDPVALAEAAWSAVQPLGTHGPAATWRKRMVRVEVRRAAEGL